MQERSKAAASVTDTTYFHYDGQGKPAMVVWNGTRFGYLYNAQGDVLGLITGGHSEVVKYTYDAWGKLLKISGARKGDLALINPFRYRGYIYDAETEMYYLQTRYYKPEWGRFISADTVYNGCFSLFSYCSNSPINNIDPTGNKLLVSGEIVEYLQQLTGNMIIMNGDEVGLKEDWKENTIYPLSTQLVSYIISDPRTITVNIDTKIDVAGATWSNGWGAFYDEENDWHGVGTNSDIGINPKKFNNEPAFTVLVHELIHAWHNLMGCNARFIGEDKKIAGVKNVLNMDEHLVCGCCTLDIKLPTFWVTENQIRKEHKYERFWRH